VIQKGVCLLTRRRVILNVRYDFFPNDHYEYFLRIKKIFRKKLIIIMMIMRITIQTRELSNILDCCF